MLLITLRLDAEGVRCAEARFEGAQILSVVARDTLLIQWILHVMAPYRCTNQCLIVDISHEPLNVALFRLLRSYPPKSSENRRQYVRIEEYGSFSHAFCMYIQLSTNIL